MLVKGELLYDIVCVIFVYVDVVVMCYFDVGFVVEFVIGCDVLVINGGDGLNEYLI